MPVIEGGQVLRGGQDFGGVLGGQVIYGGQEIEPEQGGRTQPDSEALEMSVGPFRRSGAPPNGWYNGVADKGATAVDIVTGTHYTNTGIKAATVWTVEAPPPEITLLVNPGAIGDTASHDYSLRVDGAGDATLLGMVGTWTNNEAGDLCPPEDGVYELTVSAQSTQSAGGPIALRVSINSASSAYAVGNTFPYIPAIPDGGSAQPVIVNSTWYGDPPVVGPDRSLGGLRVQHLVAASDGATVTFLVRVRKIGDVPA